MDIRNFFKKPRLDTDTSNQSQNQSLALSSSTSSASSIPCVPSISAVEPAISSSVVHKAIPEKYDIGQYIGPNSNLSFEEKLQIFENIWVPEKNYNFNKTGEKRSFRFEWLETYAPWLAYSEVVNGALCKFCVIFKQKVHRGLQGGFIIRGFSKYVTFHESARNHTRSEWHKQAVAEATNLIAIKEKKKSSITSAISQFRSDIIVKNREILGSIVRTIVFCGTHDLPLRGKTSDEGNFRDLLKFRVQAGDTTLKQHLENGPRNAQYISVRTEHEIINICEEILTNDIVSKANASKCFSILADETTDIAGVEQLSLGVRFIDFNNDKLVIREEFLGFVTLKTFDAQSISEAILKKCEILNLNMEYCIGQGYDGCSTMAGKENGVKSIIQKKYPNIHFVHCSSHRLNLVVHDLNQLSEIRNTIGTIKEIINFFRESNIRRQLLPSIPMLCETRWTEKHKTIGLFKRHLKVILEQLHEISEGTKNSKQKAFYLYSAVTKPVFLICVFIMAKYSEILEPISVLLQNKQINLLDCQNHIRRLISVLQDERDQFGNIYTECENFSQSIGIDITIPRIVSKQSKRANYTTDDAEEYFKFSLFLPYIDSLISSLTIRFSEENKCIFNLFRLYPSDFKALPYEEREKLLLEIDKSGNLLNDGLVWHKIVNDTEINNVEDMLKAAKFVPAIQRELLTSLSLPVTTATVERSFSTLRRVKTWLRSTMSESRLTGLCMLSTHRQIIANDEEGFVNKIIDKFGQDERRLVFLFN